MLSLEEQLLNISTLFLNHKPLKIRLLWPSFKRSESVTNKQLATWIFQIHVFRYLNDNTAMSLDVLCVRACKVAVFLPKGLQIKDFLDHQVLTTSELVSDSFKKSTYRK